MASQRVTLAKIAGVSVDTIITLANQWQAARTTTVQDEWSPDQWPIEVRKQADTFADRLRANGCAPPVIHFVEWSDLWSMGDIFCRWLTPRACRNPTWICGDRYQILGYALPDRGRLKRHLAKAGPQQFPEYDLFIRRLEEAVVAWDSVVDRSVLVVLREVLGGLVTEEELAESLAILPPWLTEIDA